MSLLLPCHNVFPLRQPIIPLLCYFLHHSPARRTEIQVAPIKPSQCGRGQGKKVVSGLHLIHLTHLTVTIWPPSKTTPFIWAIKMAATASYRAVPSMLMVAPTGRTNLVTRLSIPRLSSRQRKVTGKVPALRDREREGRGKGGRGRKKSQVHCSEAEQRNWNATTMSLFFCLS